MENILLLFLDSLWGLLGVGEESMGYIVVNGE